MRASRYREAHTSELASERSHTERNAHLPKRVMSASCTCNKGIWLQEPDFIRGRRGSPSRKALENTVIARTKPPIEWLAAPRWARPDSWLYNVYKRGPSTFRGHPPDAKPSRQKWTWRTRAFHFLVRQPCHYFCSDCRPRIDSFLELSCDSIDEITRCFIESWFFCLCAASRVS